MNKLDRERLTRLEYAIETIPLPHDGSGTKTASMIGFARYQNDMREALPLVKKILNDMLFESIDTPENDIEIGWDYNNPDKTLDKLETWIESRKRENWN